MATPTDRYTDNIPGTYYVDTDCIACDTCFGLAPRHFRLTPSHDHAIVYQQPISAQDKTACELALEACPVGAIGNDGETV